MHNRQLLTMTIWRAITSSSFENAWQYHMFGLHVKCSSDVTLCCHEKVKSKQDKLHASLSIMAISRTHACQGKKNNACPYQTYVFFFSFVGVHPLRMTTTSSSTLKTQDDTAWRGKIHVLKKLIVRRGCTDPSPLTWPPTKKSDGTIELATTDSMDGCNFLPETQIFGTRLRVGTSLVLYVGVPFHLWRCRREVRV